MPNPTGVSRSALRELIWQLRIIGAHTNEYFDGAEPDADAIVARIRSDAERGELIALRLLDGIQQRCEAAERMPHTS